MPALSDGPDIRRRHSGGEVIRPELSCPAIVQTALPEDERAALPSPEAITAALQQGTVPTSADPE